MGRGFKSALKDLKDDDIFCLGSKTNFFFIGTKSDWERDKPEIEQWCSEFTRADLDNAIEAWERRIFCGLPKLENFSTREKWAKEAFDCVQTLNNLQKRLINCRRAVNGYKPVERRMVVEEYDRELDGAHVILLSGTEVGKYWTREEYISKNVEPSEEEDDDTVFSDND